MRRESIRKIVETSILVALATVIDLLFELVPFCNMPTGGHISVAMLAIIINGFRNGWSYGIAGGLVFSIINWLLGGLTLHIGSIFLDYIFAFTVLGFSGLFQKQGKKLWKFCLIIVTLCTIRYLSHSFSGLIFFKEYAYVPDFLDWQLEGNALYWIYSFIIYNLPYMSLSTILCLIVGVILHTRGLVYKNTELEAEELRKL